MQLENLTAKGDPVFLQGTNSINQAPTLLIAYLALYVKHEYYSDLEKLADYVKSEYPLSCPNLHIAKLVVNKNKTDFHLDPNAYWIQY